MFLKHKITFDGNIRKDYPKAFGTRCMDRLSFTVAFWRALKKDSSVPKSKLFSRRFPEVPPNCSSFSLTTYQSAIWALQSEIFFVVF